MVGHTEKKSYDKEAWWTYAKFALPVLAIALAGVGYKYMKGTC